MIMRNAWTTNFSTAEIEELQRRQATRDWNIEPRRGPRAKGGKGAWGVNFTPEQLRLFRAVMLDLLR